MCAKLQACENLCLLVLPIIFTNYNLLIVCYQLCVKGKRYKYFTSASTFFQSKCDMNVVNYVFFTIFCLLQA